MGIIEYKRNPVYCSESTWYSPPLKNPEPPITEDQWAEIIRRENKIGWWQPSYPKRRKQAARRINVSRLIGMLPRPPPIAGVMV